MEGEERMDARSEKEAGRKSCGGRIELKEQTTAPKPYKCEKKCGQKSLVRLVENAMNYNVNNIILVVVPKGKGHLSKKDSKMLKIFLTT